MKWGKNTVFHLDNDTRLVVQSSGPDDEADDGEHEDQGREPEGGDADLGQQLLLFLGDGVVHLAPLLAALPGRGRGAEEGRVAGGGGGGDPGVAAGGGRLEGGVVVHRRRARRRGRLRVARRALHVVSRPRRRRRECHVRLRRRVLHPILLGIGRGWLTTASQRSSSACCRNGSGGISANVSLCRVERRRRRRNAARVAPAPQSGDRWQSSHPSLPFPSSGLFLGQSRITITQAR
jgi:hypothetical protein